MQLAVETSEVGERIDKVVARRAEIGRARVGQLFAEGAIFLIDADGRRRKARKGDRAAAGTTIVLDVEDTALELSAVADSDVALHVVFERDDLVVVEKPARVAAKAARSPMRCGLATQRWPPSASRPASLVFAIASTRTPPACCSLRVHPRRSTRSWPA